LIADEAALRYLIAAPDVTSIQEDVPLPLITTGNISVIGADAAWNMGYNGAGQTVAILDTGVDSSHPISAGVSYRKPVSRPISVPP